QRDPRALARRADRDQGRRIHRGPSSELISLLEHDLDAGEHLVATVVVGVDGRVVPIIAVGREYAPKPGQAAVPAQFDTEALVLALDFEGAVVEDVGI